MAVLKPRTKLVYFRVSEDEFEEFSRACQREGARSLSDLARSAIHQAMNGAAGADAPASIRLNRLETLIGELSVCLDRLNTMMESQSVADRIPAQVLKSHANRESA